jgi:hypothetical protein
MQDFPMYVTLIDSASDFSCFVYILVISHDHSFVVTLHMAMIIKLK